MLLFVHEEATLGRVGAVHRTTDTAVATVVEFLAGLEHLAQVGLVKVGDKLAVVILETHLATLLQGHDVHHRVYQVVLVPVTLHPFSGAGDGGVSPWDNLLHLTITRRG